jgi:type I site-specific restriction endonuclease
LAERIEGHISKEHAKWVDDWSLVFGLAVREYHTDIGPADYVLFVDRIPVGVSEAKKEEEGHRLNVHEGQAEYYAQGKLKWSADNHPLVFVYESTGNVTRFTDMRDPKPRARPVFSFHKPETLKDKIRRKNSLRHRLQKLPDLPVEGLCDCQVRAIVNLEKSRKIGPVPWYRWPMEAEKPLPPSPPFTVCSDLPMPDEFVHGGHQNLGEQTE